MLIGDDKIGWETINPTLFLSVEQYSPDEIERACVNVWGGKGEQRAVRLLAMLRERRHIMERLATVTSSNSPPKRNYPDVKIAEIR